MGLTTDIQADIGDAFDEDLADAVASFTAVTKEKVYDPVTGAVTAPDPVLFSGRGVISGFSQKEIALSGGALSAKDFQLLSLVNEVTGTIVTGTEVTSGGTTYTVGNVSLDPTGATVTAAMTSSG